MARPIKLNADYFPHDADMRNDPKIKALRRKFGHTGFSVWVMLLETFTDADNFEVRFSELQIELISGDFDVEPAELRQIIEYCKTVELIEENGGFIYSKRQKERFSGLVHKRERDRKRVFGGENSQSKVNKSKVKESKVKEIDKSISKEPQNRIVFSDVFNTNWMQSIYRMLAGKTSYENLLSKWDEFQIEIEARDDLYREASEYRSHFSNWVKIELDKNGSNSGLLQVTDELINQV